MKFSCIGKILILLTSVFSLFSCGGEKATTITVPPLPDEPQEQATFSIARQWNEVLLQAIRNDFARPTVHARNLFHVSAAMYDAWTVIAKQGTPYLVNSGLELCPYNGNGLYDDNQSAQEQAISFASYRLIEARFALAPKYDLTMALAEDLMLELGYDLSHVSTDVSDGNAASLGNYIAECYLSLGLLDGAKEDIYYSNVHYTPVNPPLDPTLPGNPDLVDANRWQSLDLGTYIDQSGNLVSGAIEFLGAEWGEVMPFALAPKNMARKHRNGGIYQVYHDPGMPPQLNDDSATEYEWNFSLVAKWSSHLDAQDGVLIDISPASQGNVDFASLPTSFTEYQSFYQADGGDNGQGYSINPVTEKPYEPQWVPRGDYTRVLAEFWADGPDSETPPGHWFVIMNSVFEHPQFERRFEGQGEIISALEWDVKSYFALGGAMHDAAIAAWSVKGWYDYIRPISAIRAMADRGQRSDQQLPSYHPQGMVLATGYVELVDASDPLAGEHAEHVGKIKIKAWRGPDFIGSPDTDEAGVGWILAENWWPYQRPSFVTPPFAGYVSGHSTFSRAAAELLTALTGSAYFPGGMSEFEIEQNQFLVFEEGPSIDLTLQWATYRDASDQCSLSRIWGGIHPPVDDIPGRKIGKQVGEAAFQHAKTYF